MCGRYTLTASRSELGELFNAEPCPTLLERFERYNLAPQQEAPIVRVGRADRVVALARWGLVPSWVREPGELRSMPINARADRVADSPMFRGALHRRRCLVPASGFFEWQSRGARQPKQPYYLRPRAGGIFAFAGLWERWEGRDDEPLQTFTILTVDADEVVKPIHDRMPVVLPKASWDTWLDPQAPMSQEQLTSLLTPATTGDSWQVIAVSRHVNRPANDDPTCIEPLDQIGGSSSQTQTGLFD